MNLLDYIISEKETPIDIYHELDALVLSMLSYFEFEKTKITEFPLLLSQVDCQPILSIKSSHLRRQHNQMVTNCLSSKRFKDLKILDLEHEFNHEDETQFFAMTFELDDHLFVSFRGTDFSPVGWKEDFNMSFSSTVPAQNNAVNYLNKIISQTDKPITLGGHSKGGNLAMFAAAYCHDQSRITRTYSFDGPGFREDIIKADSYQNILPKSLKFVPEDCMIGNIMETDLVPIVVDSKLFGVFQHNTFEWKIENDYFVLKDELSNTAKRFKFSLDEWLDEIDDEKRKYIIDHLYEQFKLLEIDSFEEIGQLLSFDKIKRIIDIHNQTDPQFRDELQSLIFDFIKLMLGI